MHKPTLWNKFIWTLDFIIMLFYYKFNICEVEASIDRQLREVRREKRLDT